MVLKRWRLYFLFIVFMVTGIVFTQETGEYPDRMVDEEESVISQNIQNRLKTLLSGITETDTSPAGKSVFYGGNLWEYIDGAAEAFHAYGFVALIHQDYHDKDAEVTVDIYDMGDSIRAFGMYASERSPEYHFLDVGAEGYGDAFGLNFFQDRYYVKLMVFSESDSVFSLLNIAQNISGKIEIGKNLPEIFSRFPHEDRIANSEQYLFQAPLGFAFLSPLFSVQYRKGGEVCILMVAETMSDKEAIRQVEQLADHFRQVGEIEFIPEMGQHAFRACSSYETKTVVVPFRKDLFILKDSPDDGILFLKKAIDLIARE